MNLHDLASIEDVQTIRTKTFICIVRPVNRFYLMCEGCRKSVISKFMPSIRAGYNEQMQEVGN